MHPDSGDICTCGHSYGSHSRDTTGPCMAGRRNNEAYDLGEECPCPHWRQPVWDMVGELAACIAEEAHLAARNPASHDCYQLALEALEPVRAAIARARDAQGGEK